MPFFLVGRKIHRDPADGQIWDFVNTFQMFLPQSNWTHGGVVETSLATARLEASVTSALGYTAICKWGSPAEGVVGLG